MCFKIGALKNFANLTEKISVFHSLLKKVAGPQAYNFIKKRFQNRYFSVKVDVFEDKQQ